MCGIAALFGKGIDQETLSAFPKMLQLVAHRGPDGEAFRFFPSFAALGHRRLAIVDLSDKGSQPMQSPCGRYWITFNGEIYNYKELREELAVPFRTETDTEVLLAAYSKWGASALHKLNGMFAFVLYDSHENTLFACRDRFGIKPLYFWQMASGVLAFASEIKQFTCLPGWQGRLNGQLAHDFLNWGVKDHTGETLFQGVRQLRGGEYLLLRPGDVPHPKRWYTLPHKPFHGTFEEAVAGFKLLLQDAIRLQLRADVPIGSCLSGGLDSSSILCLAKGKIQNAFIACSATPRFDESHFANIVVQETAVSPHYTTPTLSSLFRANEELVWHHDEPFIGTSQFAQWSVFALVKEQKVKVVLNGQGSDEQLAGYSGFFGNRFYELFCSLSWRTLAEEISLLKQYHPHIPPFSLLGNKLLPDLFRQPVRKFFGRTSAHSGWLNHAKLGADPRDPFRSSMQHSVADQCRQQLFQSSLPMLLHFEDRNSMAHSVESRVPFLDHRLVEFLNGLPSEFKIGKGWTKRVLREGMKGVLPEPIRLRRDKMGFVTAEEEWFCCEAPQIIRNKIAQVVEASQGILRPSILHATDQILLKRRPFNPLLWRIISFGNWLERFSMNIK